MTDAARPVGRPPLAEKTWRISAILSADDVTYLDRINSNRSEAIRQLIQEHKTMTAIDTRQNKINAVMDCLEALKRGVQEPTIVQNEDGTFEYIPGAYLNDISYTGSHQVVMDVSEAAFGSDFDVDEASDEKLQQAAEWAADEWEWEVEE